jgi:membrane dipeptidase
MVTAPQGDWGVSTEAARLHRQAIVWDMHGCMPLRPDADLGEIARYARAGASFVSLNVGFDLVPWSEAVKIAALFRAWVLARPECYLLADTAADVHRAKHGSKLAVARALDGQISMIAAFYRLGVRSMLLAYNANNEFSAGCTGEDTGLTPLGHQALAEMNRVGMIVDC